MIRSILIFGYIVIVLLISGLARANKTVNDSEQNDRGAQLPSIQTEFELLPNFKTIEVR